MAGGEKGALGTCGVVKNYHHTATLPALSATDKAPTVTSVIANAGRLGGDTRVATALEIFKHASNTQTVLIVNVESIADPVVAASGTSAFDALVGTSLVDKHDALVLKRPGDDFTPPAYIRQLVYLGGEQVNPS